MSCLSKCKACPLRLAHDDPSWRFDDEAAKRIRPATLSDENAIGAYIMAMPPEVRRRRYHYPCSAEHACECRTQQFRECPPDDWHHLELIIELPCGAIGGVCHAYELNGLGHHDVGISVAPELAGRGTGRALLKAMERYARASGHVERLFANTELDNPGMQNLARACGYRPATFEERQRLNVDCGESPWILPLAA